jgi:hypothetical protein
MSIARIATLVFVLTATTVLAEPVTTVNDYAWLAGSWEGRVAGFADALAEITFQPPRAGVLTAVMRLTSKGQVIVVELLSMVDTPHGLELRFRHFSPQLAAYEADFKQTMALTSQAGDTGTFTNTVAYQKELPSTQARVTQFIRKSADEFLGHSEIIDDHGKSATIDASYRRVKGGDHDH